MGIIAFKLLMPLVLASGVSSTGETPHRSNEPVNVPIRSISLPTLTGTDGPIQFTVQTELPSDCYELQAPSVRISYERNVILFHLQAVQVRPVCRTSATPFSQVVSVGRLSKGRYEVRSLKDLDEWGVLQVQDHVSFASN